MLPWLEVFGIPCDGDLRNLIFWEMMTFRYEANKIYPSHHLGQRTLGYITPKATAILPPGIQGTRWIWREGAVCATQSPTKWVVISIWHKILFTTSWYFILLRRSVLQRSMNLLTSDYWTMLSFCGNLLFIMAWNADPFSQAQILIVRYVFSSH